MFTEKTGRGISVGADAHSGLEFPQRDVPSAGGFLLVQKVTKDTVKGGAKKRDPFGPLRGPNGKGSATEWTKADFSSKSQHEGYGVCADADAPPLTIPPSETKDIAWLGSWAIS